MKCALLVLAAATLYEQSLVELLRERFADAGISYLLVKAPGGEVLGAQWADSERAAAPGSVVKPFTAVAYAESHAGRFPEFTCGGKESGCWLPRGHGRIGIADAVAHSCNAYFRALASEVRIEDAIAAAKRYGIDPPAAGAPVETLIGLGEGWKVRPLALARAYVRLAADSRAAEVVRGMVLCARSGTGSAAGFGLMKTGTAPCTHQPRAPGDGFAIALYPEDAPRYALLVRVHGTTGAHAAEVAGRMLRVLRDGK